MLQHTWWTRIQPTGGDEWKWSDATQKTLDDLSFSTLGEFLWTPPWASGGKERTAPPKDDADFARYVRETVSHYRGSIRHWEVWNEPHYHGFWSGTPEQYAHLLAVAYREAKKADPACTVLGGGGVSLGSKAWIGKMIAALPDERCMDAFSIHYLVPDSAKADLAWLRATLKDKGRNIDVPIWNTEESVLTSSFLDQSRQGYREPEARYHFRNACCELVRTYMENIANGVQRVFYYELADPWRQGEFPKPRVPAEKNALGTGMWDDGRMPRPIAAAHAALAMAIEGKTFSSRITRPGRAAFIFQDKDSATAVLYVPFATFAQKTTLKLAIPPGAKASDFALIDFMGNQTPVDAKAQTIEITLSREPVYLTWATRGGGDVLRRLLDAGND
jgi:hypothetical protein